MKYVIVNGSRVPLPKEYNEDPFDKQNGFRPCKYCMKQVKNLDEYITFNRAHSMCQQGGLNQYRMK